MVEGYSNYQATAGTENTSADHSALWSIVAGVVITAIVLAIVGYLYTNWRISKINEEASQLVDSVKMENTTLNNDLVICQNNKMALETQLTDQERTAEAAAEAVYKDWSTYNAGTGFSFRYPADWQLSEQLDSQVSGVEQLDRNCLTFGKTKNNKASLTICYLAREAKDTQAASWLPDIVLHDYPSVVAVSLKMGEKNITQKIISSYNQKVRQVVYAPNLKEDGSSKIGRIVSGDYYFTAVAEAITAGENGADSEIPIDYQTIMDKIVASFKLTPITPAAQ
ncbi:MAG: hypothetical protein WC480_01660 [Patescibacteria group bacterium]